jgi:putative tryptophan/tyrosine transport system substrate-binding protein
MTARPRQPRAGQVARVALVTAGRIGSGPTPNLEALRQGLLELGYVEGKTIQVEYCTGEGDPARIPGLLAELIQRGVDVICASGTVAVQAAQRTTATIPIVMVVESGDPVGTGLTRTAMSGKGNVTGLTSGFSQIAGRRLELLKEVVPSATRVAVLWNPGVPDKAVDWRYVREAAAQLGVDLLSVEATRREDLPEAFAQASARAADGLLVLADPLTWRHRLPIVALAEQHTLPAMHTLREFVDVGGLMAYGPNLQAMYYRVAGYVDQLLRGADPADLPIAAPPAFELALNIKTARQLGVVFPDKLVQRADHLVSS